MKPFAERSVAEIVFSTPAAIFYGTFAEELYRASGSPKGWPAVVVLVAMAIVRGSIGLWVVTDSKESGRTIPYDFTSFVFFLPWLALIYVFVRHRGRGFIPLGWYFLLTFTATAIAWLPNGIARVLMNH